jgi:hypothetical protein
LGCLHDMSCPSRESPRETVRQKEEIKVAVRDPARTDQPRRAGWERTRGLLSSKRAVRGFQSLMRGGLANFATVFCILLVWELIRDDPDQTIQDRWMTTAILAGFAVALGVAVHALRTMPEPRPARPYALSRHWRRHASNVGSLFGMRVAMALGWLLAMGAILADILVGVSQERAGAVILVVLLAGTVWACVARYRLELRMLKLQDLPETRLADDVRERVRALQVGADDFERAMRQAATAADTMQAAIDARKRRLREVHDEYQRYEQRSDQARRDAEVISRLSQEEQDALFRWSADQRDRERRRSLWREIVFFLLGVVASTILSTDAIRELVQRWLHLG